MPRDPTGSVVANLFTLRRLENGLVGEIDQLLAALFDDIVAQLARIDPTAVSADSYRRRRIERFIAEVEALTGDKFGEIHKLVRQRVAEIGVFQGEEAVRVLRDSLAGVSVTIQPGRVGLNLMKSILDTNPLEGHLLKDWAAAQERSVVFRVRQQVQLGMAQNETMDDMVRRIRGRQVGFRYRDTRTGLFTTRGVRGARAERAFAGGVMKTTTREAESLVRTAVNHISNEAHFRTYSENGDITSEYEYVATLDSRTTEICMGLDGQRFRYDDPNAKRPPQHWSCRSRIVPIIDWAALGVDPPAEGTRASMAGQVPASTTYEAWLKDQSAAFQDELLGPGRAQLFRDGKISLRDLVRTDNSRVTLEELRRKAA